ncbi:MAG: formylglycine-generating enzyme family protein [Candidatus Methylomirabilia bacterium]
MIPGVLLLAASLLAASPCTDPQRMVRVPDGPFWMGSDRGERGFAYSLSSPAVKRARWYEAELPRRRVTLAGFCIDRFLVTQGEYAAFVAATGHRPPGITKNEYLRQGFLVHDYDREVIRYLWQERHPPRRLTDHPVVLVSVADAEAYCRWRHPDLRLATEAEWEKAARGDDGRHFPWGDEWDGTRLNSAERGPGSTTPVSRYASGASSYGLFDAVGNVFQWTASAFADGRQVLKGCAWDDEAGLCRPAFRHGRPRESRHILIGFRCAGPATRP